MSHPTFERLNDDWNAEPNAPYEKVAVSGTIVRLMFFLNPWAYGAEEDEKGCLTFEQCSMWRLVLAQLMRGVSLLGGGHLRSSNSGCGSE
jgi:hypothetical protein